MADYLIHFNKNHDPKSGRFTFGDGDGKSNKVSKGDKKPFSYDYYDYTKDHIDRVKPPKSLFVKEIYTDKNGQKHELKFLESTSKNHMKRKYGSERSKLSLYARNKSEDVDLHENASITAGVISAINFVDGAMAMSVGAIAPGAAIIGVADVYAAKSLIESNLAKKIDEGLMNMSPNELKEHKQEKKLSKAIA